MEFASAMRNGGFWKFVVADNRIVTSEISGDKLPDVRID
jgi:hypothetical protein